MANPRKFSEKIALHNQKQAEETAAFERIMQEVSVTRQPQRMLSPQYLRPLGSVLGGSLPNVNQMSGPPMEMPIRQNPYEEFKQPHHRHHMRFDTRPRPYQDPHRRTDLPNRYPRHIGVPGPPHCGTFLSPPADTSWRRTNSDSALHQSVMNPNSQEAFSSIHQDHQQNLNTGIPPPHLRGMVDMPVPKMSSIDTEKLQQHLAGVSRPKSCEDTQMNVLSNADANHRQGLPPNPSNPGLSHMAHIDTGSLPDLTALQIPSPLPNPIDYDEQQKLPQNHQPGGPLQSPASMLYNQARSTGNIPAESAINQHIGGHPSRGNQASPNRSRRHTHNGPSPLSITSDPTRRMKFHGGGLSPKIGVKPDLKSPPIGGPYPYQYPVQPGQGPIHQQIRQHLQHTPNNAHPILRVDVNAASKVGQYANQSHPHSITGHRQSTGPSMTSPITSPTSPTSRNSLSPGASPQHLPELTSGNPALSEAYYRTEPPNMQPLRQQFEHFHVVNDTNLPHNAPVGSDCSNLELLRDLSYPYHTSYGSQRSSDSSIYTYNNGSSNLLYKNLISPTAKIPDIVFTGVDDAQSSNVLSGEPTLYPGDLVSDYCPGDDLKTNLGLEELQMLTQEKIDDPVINDDEWRVNST